jgi:hypothetical protein
MFVIAGRHHGRVRDGLDLPEPCVDLAFGLPGLGTFRLPTLPVGPPKFLALLDDRGHRRGEAAAAEILADDPAIFADRAIII